MIWRAIRAGQRRLSAHTGEVGLPSLVKLPLPNCSQGLIWDQIAQDLERRQSTLAANDTDKPIREADQQHRTTIINESTDNRTHLENDQNNPEAVTWLAVRHSSPELVFIIDGRDNACPSREIPLESINSISDKHYLSVKTADVCVGRAQHSQRVDVISTAVNDNSFFTSSSLDVTKPEGDVSKIASTRDAGRVNRSLTNICCCLPCTGPSCLVGREKRNNNTTTSAAGALPILGTTHVTPVPPNTRHPMELVGTVTRRRSMLNSSVRTMVVIFVGFFLTYLPFVVVNLVEGVEPMLNRNWYIMTSLSFWCGSCVNPIIYGIMNKQFRIAYVSAFNSLRRKNCIQ